jgi:hypothetical protein
MLHSTDYQNEIKDEKIENFDDRSNKDYVEEFDESPKNKQIT